MAKTYLEKDQIPAVGVSQIRKFGGPVDLKIFDEAAGFTDNFPMGLTVDDLFGAVIAVKDDSYTKKYIADAVYDNDGKVYFTIGSGDYYYDKAVGRVTAL